MTKYLFLAILLVPLVTTGCGDDKSKSSGGGSSPPATAPKQ